MGGALCKSTDAKEVAAEEDKPAKKSENIMPSQGTESTPPPNANPTTTTTTTTTTTAAATPAAPASSGSPPNSVAPHKKSTGLPRNLTSSTSPRLKPAENVDGNVVPTFSRARSNIKLGRSRTAKSILEPIVRSSQSRISQEIMLSQAKMRTFPPLKKKPQQAEVINLPRGGSYIKTSIGAIQVGIPPETIKDSMVMGLDVPCYFVVPPRRFDLKMGLNVAEFEFPSYFNFFVRRRRVNFICTEDAAEAIRTIAQETLLGPVTIDNASDFSDTVPLKDRPDLRKELDFFAANPMNPTEQMTVDTLIEFHTFDENGSVNITDPSSPDVVTIREEGGAEFVFIEEGMEIARVQNTVVLPQPKEEYVEYAEDHKPFAPPAFGITVLGNSHGFDPSTSTSGYVLWINGRGVMVDPPPHSGSILRAEGIPSRNIDAIILSHAHADHDAGTFQKILEEKRIKVITTKTIMDSFMRKYSGVTGMDEGFLRRMFVYRQAVIGEPLRIHCAEIHFFYSLHSIPCIGFELFYGNKSMFFSGDTCIVPDRINLMHEKGVLREGRRDFFLKNYPLHHDVVLHEAGVPPLHTPVTQLMKLDPEIKKNLFAVHIAAKDIKAAGAEEAGIRHAAMGMSNTIILDNVEPPPFAKTVRLLDLIGGIDMFKHLNIEQLRDLMQCCRLVEYKAGDVIVQEGTPGDMFYIIAEGVATVSIAAKKDVKKQFRFGDYFGEASLVTGNLRGASILATTEVTLWCIDKVDFIFLFQNTTVIDSIMHLVSIRKQRSYEVLNLNNKLKMLSESQKTELQFIMYSSQFQKGECLWKEGVTAEFAFLIDGGSVELSGSSVAQHTVYGPGTFCCDLEAMQVEGKGVHTATVVSLSNDLQVYKVSYEEIITFFEQNPGIGLAFYDSLAVT